MKFILQEPTALPITFGDVEENQFFVDKDGYLCQKCSYKLCNYIADHNGKPFSDRREIFSSNSIIQKILPKVAKIEF